MPPLCHSCCGPLGQVCGFVGGCNGAAVAGCAVRLLDATNTVISSTTSDGSGNYCLPFSAAGSYKVQADAPATPVGYAQGTAGLNSYTSGTTTGRNVSLGIDAAYRCTLCCPYPIKLSLTLSTPAGNITGTWDAVNSWWQATKSYSGSTIGCVGGVQSAPAAGTYTVKFRLQCISPGNVWRFTFVSPGVYYFAGGAPSCDPSRFVFYDDTSATGCGSGGVSQQSGMFADQSCGTGAFDHTWTIPANETLVCQNGGGTTSVAIPFAGNYEWTF